MEGVIESIELLVNLHKDSFDRGQRLNTQLKMLQIYIANAYGLPEIYGTIDKKNEHFEAYTCPEFEKVLTAVGFVHEGEVLNFEGNREAIPLELVRKELEEHRHVTFAELVEMIEKGETPPGIKKIEEQPIGEAVITSGTDRPQKPWVI